MVQLKAVDAHDGRRLEGLLFVVATPIGNLEDITLRALADAAGGRAGGRRRHPAHRQLCCATSTSTRQLLSLHEHNEHARAQRSSRAWRRATRWRWSPTPARRRSPIPGPKLVAAAAAAGIRVEPMPGASAVMAALVSVWMSTRRIYVSSGFHQLRQKTRKQWFGSWSARSRRHGPWSSSRHPIGSIRTLEELSILVKDQSWSSVS